MSDSDWSKEALALIRAKTKSAAALTAEELKLIQGTVKGAGKFSKALRLKKQEEESDKINNAYDRARQLMRYK